MSDVDLLYNASCLQVVISGHPGPETWGHGWVLSRGTLCPNGSGFLPPGPTFPWNRARCSPLLPHRWITTLQDSALTPQSYQAATAVASHPSAGAARRKHLALKIQCTIHQCPARALATPDPGPGLRRLHAKRAKHHRPTACTSGLCGAQYRYLTAFPSQSPPTHLLCPPNRWRPDPATWRMGPGGLTPARGPGPCPGKSPSSEALSHRPALDSLSFTGE